MDLDGLFEATPIYTDADGHHTDADGQSYTLAVVGGETTWRLDPDAMVIHGD